MKYYYLGFVESYGDNGIEEKSLEELKSDARLIVADNAFIFTSEDYLEEVKTEYKIEVVSDMTEWLEEIYDDNYNDYIMDKFVGSEMVSEEEFEKAIYARVNKLNKVELSSLKIIELFQLEYKKILVQKLTSYTQELESEIKNSTI